MRAVGLYPFRVCIIILAVSSAKLALGTPSDDKSGNISTSTTVAVDAAQQPDTTGKRSRPFPVDVSSFDSEFCVQGEFHGVCQVLSNSVELVLLSSTLRLRPGFGEDFINSIRVGLGYHTTGVNWAITNQVELVKLEKPITSDKALPLGPLKIRIPADRALDLRDCWIIFEILMPGPSSCYAHSSEDLFKQRLFKKSIPPGQGL